MPRSTRREFLSRSAQAAMTLGGAGLLPGCPEAPLVPITPTSQSAQVHTVRGRALADMTRAVLESLGGIQSVVHPGESVFIKVNMVTAGMLPGNVVERGECSKPEIVMTVAEECLKAGASSVTIGDAAQRDHFDWSALTSLDSSTDYASETASLNAAYAGKVTLACLMGDSPSWVEVPSPYTDLGALKIADAVMQSDRLISIPVFKTHMMTKVTGSLKNCLGVTPAEQRGVREIKSRLDLHAAAGGVHQLLLDVVRAVQPDLALVDLSVCVEGNGPVASGGLFSRRVDMRERLGDFVLLAGADLVAADATACRIISQDPQEVKHLDMAYNQGFGQIAEDLIEIIGETVNSLRVTWTPATFAKAELPEELRDIPPYNCVNL